MTEILKSCPQPPGQTRFEIEFVVWPLSMADSRHGAHLDAVIRVQFWRLAQMARMQTWPGGVASSSLQASMTLTRVFVSNPTVARIDISVQKSMPAKM